MYMSIVPFGILGPLILRYAQVYSRHYIFHMVFPSFWLTVTSRKCVIQCQESSLDSKLMEKSNVVNAIKGPI